MADMKACTGRIREHIENEKLLLRGVVCGLKGPVVFPVPLPLFLYFGKRIRHMLLSNEKDVPARSIGER